ncbi:MAG: hypothetical protein M3R36_19460 [Bacteroidota bacterium]|nr:hypothetical protein [Bacteroidota bacterium]
MKTNLKIIFILLLFINVLPSFAQHTGETDKYSQVRIFVSGEDGIKRISDAGLLIDHAVRKPDYMDVWLSSKEIEMLKKSGVNYNILVEDWNKYYESLPKMSNAEMRRSIIDSKKSDNVSHSIYGSMGGFLTYNEVNAKLDSMRLQFPGLISSKFSLGITVQGRSIWTVRLTKNPDVSTGRPEVWYHSLIHAREPESMEHGIYFMYWLLENYGIDPIATYILNNRELYFTPVINPDGYVYNQTNSPNGGGLWRKNRKANAGGSFGIDLNRNYGTFQFWNSPNGGSSTSPSSDTYRGPSPFSEPETQAVMNFVNSRNIQAVLGSHTYGNLLIKPWAWQDPLPTPDDNIFNEYFVDMTKYNHYTTGTPSQTVGYMVRGGADDWYYNDSAHSPHRIIAMTPETGTTGFWPTQAEIIPLAQGMLFTNQYFALIGGAYVYPVSVAFNKSNYNAGENGILKINFKNKGLATAQNVKIECKTSSYYLNVPVTFYNYSSLNSFQSDSASFGFTISSAVPNNSAIPLEIKFLQDDTNVVYSETKYLLIGNGNISLADSSENGFSKWTTTQGWAVTSSQSHSPTRSFTDSPSGNYLNNANNSMTLILPVNVSTFPVTYLSFWHRYNTEPGYDFCNVEVSSNNGSVWQTAASFNGVNTSWSQQVLDISSYANASTQMKIRFTLKADGGLVEDGWYVDDIKLSNYNLLMNNVITNVNLTLAQEGFYNPVSGSLNLSDTVSVYLRNTNAPYSIVDSSKCVIDSLTLSGSSGFTNAPTGIYYIVVRHRNCIETWSKAGGEAYSFGGIVNYDFTSSNTQAFGNNLKLVGTRYCIFSGDVNQDEIVDLVDLSLIENDAFNFLSGYLSTDVNGDYVADIADLTLTDNNGFNLVETIRP